MLYDPEKVIAVPIILTVTFGDSEIEVLTP